MIEGQDVQRLVEADRHGEVSFRTILSTTVLSILLERKSGIIYRESQRTSVMPETTALHEIAAQSGAVFAEEFGWLMPAHYGNAAAEYETARQQIALFDLSHHGQVEVSGADAASFLHNLCTNEVKNLPPGHGCEAFLTTGQAKIVALVTIYRAALAPDRPTFLLDAGPGMGDKVIKHLDRYLISEQVELSDRTHTRVQMHLAGPQAHEVLERVLGMTMPELAELRHTSGPIAGVACLIRRRQPLGLPGYDILCERAHAAAVWPALITGGAQPAGLQAYHILRVEAGTPVYGLDIDETNLPQEVGRVERTISFTKGCYIGQETVARIRTYGHVNRSLTGLLVNGATAATSGAKLFRGDKEVGHITSSVVSPRLGQPIALAYVRRGSEQPGTVLEVEGVEGWRATQITSLPFRV
jgi:folate-binding protein YgfZ